MELMANNENETEYLDTLFHVLQNGEKRQERTGTGTISMFGCNSTYDLTQGFPLLTSKRIYWKGVVGELLWFLRGETNIQWLVDNGINIWNEWANDEGELGPVYGYQWRNFPKVNMDGSTDGTVDQIEQLIEGLRTDPTGRRHIVCAWNPGMLHEMRLPPCHAFFQFYITNNGELDCQLYQRSADMFLGVPFNIASYSLLQSIIALKLGLKPGMFHHCIGDAHIYLNHVDQVKEQIYSRKVHEPPQLQINPDVQFMDWSEMEIGHFAIRDYEHSGVLQGEISK